MQIKARGQRPEASIGVQFADALSSLLSPSLTSDLWPLASPLAVALSGGADSMACALLAQHYARARNLQIVTLTVDHGLRPESRAEAEQVAAWMRARGIPHHILTPEHRPASNNLQEAARIWRYDALAEFCHAHGILHCLVAHNAGDNRETVLHSQSRGNTADGNAGMTRVRNHRGVRFLRPLLTFERAELEHYLRAQQAEWINDPSNQNRRFARVRNRAALAQSPAQVAALHAMLEVQAAARRARDEALAEAAIRCVTLHPLGFATIDLHVLHELENNLASQLIADLLTTIGGNTQRPRAHETARLMQSLAEPFKKRTLHRCEITRSGDTLTIARELARVAAPITLTGSGNVTWDDRFRIHYSLPANCIYTLRPLGNDGRKQLTTHHAPLTTPFATPSLWHLDELVHVPYITPQPAGIRFTLGFAPPKPLAPAPFW